MANYDEKMLSKDGDMAFVVICAALVLLMVPGVGLFYSGLARRKSALSLVLICFMASAVTSIQWFFWGYSLAFSETGGHFLGNLKHIGFDGLLDEPTGAIPTILFALYQGMFASVTVAIVVGAVAERGRVLPCLVFAFIWTTIVYSPIAYWTWNKNGWARELGSLDFAGGTPVHVTSGAAALAYSFILGKRRGHGTHELNYRPHKVVHIVIGTAFLWVGWFGFNAGSALAANLRAVVAIIVTNLAACMGGLTWCALDYRLERKWSAVGFCSGVVAGLVTITPAAGYIPTWAGIIFGVVGAVAANYGTKLKFFFGIDDSLDIFAVHAIGGLVGNILTAIFADSKIAGLDGSPPIAGGWINGHYAQMGYQLADTFGGGVYSFAMTCAILLALNLIPGLRIRADEDAEILGIDETEIGEFAYDYVELTREVISDIDVVETGSRYSAEARIYGMHNMQGMHGMHEKLPIPQVVVQRPHEGPSSSRGMPSDSSSNTSSNNTSSN